MCNDAPCTKASIHYDFPIRIKELAAQLGPKSSPGKADLSIDFCGVHCENPWFDQVGKEGTPLIGFRNMEQTSSNRPEEDFATITRLKKDYPRKVIVASVMGSDEQEWEALARMSEAAGADMVECNFCVSLRSQDNIFLLYKAVRVRSPRLHGPDEPSILSGIQDCRTLNPA